jgi:hypothetical protein
MPADDPPYVAGPEAELESLTRTVEAAAELESPRADGGGGGVRQQGDGAPVAPAVRPTVDAGGADPARVRLLSNSRIPVRWAAFPAALRSPA